MTQPKYVAQWVDFNGCHPEDVEAGRDYEVVHRQAWENGAWLPALCGHAKREDAERIADALSRFPKALDLLAQACRVLNDRGRLDPGRSDHNTEDGFLYREMQEFLNAKE